MTLMCERADCYLCKWQDALDNPRDIDWCPTCATREVAEGLTVCIMCAAEQANHG